MEVRHAAATVGILSAIEVVMQFFNRRFELLYLEVVTSTKSRRGKTSAI